MACGEGAGLVVVGARLVAGGVVGDVWRLVGRERPRQLQRRVPVQQVTAHLWGGWRGRGL